MGSVSLSVERSTINGQRKPFQLFMPTKIPMAANDGFINGMMIRKKMPYSVHPSIRAASRKSLDIPLKQQFLIDCESNTRNINLYKAEIGVGQYVGYEVYPTCGISTPDHLIGVEDDPRYFASPERVNADIIWMGHGYVEYIIPNYLKPGQELIELPDRIQATKNRSFRSGFLYS